MSIDLNTRLKDLRKKQTKAQESLEYNETGMTYGSRSEMCACADAVTYWEHELVQIEEKIQNLLTYGT